MSLRDFGRHDIGNVSYCESPGMTDSGLLRPQNRICDLSPNEWALARPGSVLWDSGSDSRKFTVDTYNDCIQEEIAPLYLSVMPVVMRACVELKDGSTRSGYVADLRFLENTTTINRIMNLDDENPETNHFFARYVQSNGAVLLKGILLPEVVNSRYIGSQDFEDATLELSEQVTALYLKIHSTKRARNPSYVEAQKKYRSFGGQK